MFLKVFWFFRKSQFGSKIVCFGVHFGSLSAPFWGPSALKSRLRIEKKVFRKNLKNLHCKRCSKTSKMTSKMGWPFWGFGLFFGFIAPISLKIGPRPLPDRFWTDFGPILVRILDRFWWVLGPIWDRLWIDLWNNFFLEQTCHSCLILHMSPKKKGKFSNEMHVFRGAAMTRRRRLQL